MSLAATYPPLVNPVSAIDVFAQLSPASQRFLLALMQEFLSIEQRDASPSSHLSAACQADRRLPLRAKRMAVCQLSLVHSRPHEQLV